MNLYKSVVCYVKDKQHQEVWNTLIKLYPVLQSVITFVPFESRSNYELAVNVANGFAKNEQLKPLVNYVAMFPATIEGNIDYKALETLMVRSNPNHESNIFCFSYLRIWKGDKLPKLASIDEKNIRYDTNFNLDENFSTNYIENYKNYPIANQVFENLINHLYEEQKIDYYFYEEYLKIKNQLFNEEKVEEPLKVEDEIQPMPVTEEPVVEETVVQPEPVVEEETVEEVCEEPIVEEEPQPEPEPVEEVKEEPTVEETQPEPQPEPVEEEVEEEPAVVEEPQPVEETCEEPAMARMIQPEPEPEEEPTEFVEPEIIEDEPMEITEEDHVEFDEEIDMEQAERVIIVPHKGSVLYRPYEKEFNGIIRIRKETNLKSVSAIVKQMIAKNKHTIFYFFPATAVKNPNIYEKKYLSFFNYIYKRYRNNPHVEFFRTSGNKPSIYLEDMLGFDKTTKDVIGNKPALLQYGNNKAYVQLVNWLKNNK